MTSLYHPAFNFEYASTPTCFLAGELDGEVLLIQATELWRGLRELGMPAKLIYADEDHGFFSPADQMHLTLRSLEWLERSMGSQ